MLTNDVVSFEQPGPDSYYQCYIFRCDWLPGIVLFLFKLHHQGNKFKKKLYN